MPTFVFLAHAATAYNNLLTSKPVTMKERDLKMTKSARVAAGVVLGVSGLALLRWWVSRPTPQPRAPALGPEPQPSDNSEEAHGHQWVNDATEPQPSDSMAEVVSSSHTHSHPRADVRKPLPGSYVTPYRCYKWTAIDYEYISYYQSDDEHEGGFELVGAKRKLCEHDKGFKFRGEHGFVPGCGDTCECCQPDYQYWEGIERFDDHLDPNPAAYVLGRTQPHPWENVKKPVAGHYVAPYQCFNSWTRDELQIIEDGHNRDADESEEWDYLVKAWRHACEDVRGLKFRGPYGFYAGCGTCWCCQPDDQYSGSSYIKV